MFLCLILWAVLITLLFDLPQALKFPKKYFTVVFLIQHQTFEILILTASFLIRAITAIIFSITYPTFMNTVMRIALKFTMLAHRTSGWTANFIRAILTIIVPITLVGPLYTPSTVTSKLCWFACLVSCKSPDRNIDYM